MYKKSLAMKLHLIEPTLQDQTGHCYAYANSLLGASPAADIQLECWFGKQAENLFPQMPQVHPYFYRRIRRPQTLWIYRRLLKRRQPIFVPTAGRVDLLMFDSLHSHRHADQQLFLHFHQCSINDKKRLFLQKMAARHPDIKIFAPTSKLLDIFREAGFRYCEAIPCPMFHEVARSPAQPQSFNKISFAGAARHDKGFPTVVALLDYLVTQPDFSTPFFLQASKTHAGRLDTSTQQAMQRLQQLNPPWLTVYHDTLDRSQYQELFAGAICLLPYDPVAYADKLSAVALDALCAGCPVIITQGAWMAATVSRFEAGLTVADRQPQTLYTAIKRIADHYQHYQHNALRAAQQLQLEHDPIHTLNAIKKYLFYVPLIQDLILTLRIIK